MAEQKLPKLTTGVRFPSSAPSPDHPVNFERYPVDKNSGYTRQVVWVDKEEYRLLKIDFYDRKGALLKTLTHKGYHKYLDRYWYPDEMFMVNHQNGKSTILQWSDYKFGNGFEDKDFNKNSLKRAR